MAGNAKQIQALRELTEENAAAKRLYKRIQEDSNVCGILTNPDNVPLCVKLAYNRYVGKSALSSDQKRKLTLGM